MIATMPRRRSGSRLVPNQVGTLPCRIVDHLRSRVSGFGLLVMLALVLLAGVQAWAQGLGLPPSPTRFMAAVKPKKSLVEARFSYLWAFSELRLREGDNYLILPGKRNADFPSPLFELYGETLVTKSLAVRANAWINIPQEFRNDFFLEGARAWDTQARYLGGDLAAIYQVGPGPLSVRAGIALGYRFNDFDLLSQRVSDRSQTFVEHTQVHIPYIGIYYADLDFKGLMVRLDCAASGITLAKVDAKRKLNTGLTMFDGHAVTGNWYEGLFQVAFPVSDSILGGLYARYNQLNLSGGITAQSGLKSTRFSMDSKFHLFTAGITATVMF